MAISVQREFITSKAFSEKSNSLFIKDPLCHGYDKTFHKGEALVKIHLTILNPVFLGGSMFFITFLEGLHVIRKLILPCSLIHIIRLSGYLLLSQDK